MNLGINCKVDRIEYLLKYIDKYNLFIECNDFAYPEVLNDSESIKHCMKKYVEIFGNRSILKTFHGPFLGLSVHAADKDFADLSKNKILQAFNICNDLGCEKIVFHTDYLPMINNKGYKERAVEIHSMFWQETAQKFSNIQICLENMFEYDHTFIHSVLNNCHLENLKFCLDIAHTYVFGRIPTMQWYSQMQEFLNHLHISDNDRIVDDHLALGDGKIPNHKFIKRILKDNPELTIVMELETEDELKRSLEYLERKRIL